MKDDKEENEDLVLGDVLPYLEYELQIKRVYEGNISDTQLSDIETLNIDDVSFGLQKIMCKHHIDFNNLIPQGKAAVKTLDK